MVTAFAIFSLKNIKNFLINTTYLSASLLCKQSGKAERREIYFSSKSLFFPKKVVYLHLKSKRYGRNIRRCGERVRV